MSALTLPIFRAWAAECSQLVNTRVNSCFSLLSDFPAAFQSVFVLFFYSPLVSLAPGGQGYVLQMGWKLEALPGGVQFCQAASCVCKACAGGWSCPKRCPLGKTPFAQESEASVVTAQCSCHGELHLELGLLLESQCGLLVLSCSLLTLLGCCFRAFFCRVLVNKYIRLTEKLCLYFCKQSTGSRLFFKCQVS